MTARRIFVDPCPDTGRQGCWYGDAAYKLDDLVQQEENTLQRLRADQERAGRWKKRIPFIAFFVLVLALGLAVALPRFMAVNGTSCAVLGGEWLRGPDSGKQACVFYAE